MYATPTTVGTDTTARLLTPYEVLEYPTRAAAIEAGRAGVEAGDFNHWAVRDAFGEARCACCRNI